MNSITKKITLALLIAAVAAQPAQAMNWFWKKPTPPPQTLNWGWQKIAGVTAGVAALAGIGYLCYSYMSHSNPPIDAVGNGDTAIIIDETSTTSDRSIDETVELPSHIMQGYLKIDAEKKSVQKLYDQLLEAISDQNLSAVKSITQQDIDLKDVERISSPLHRAVVVGNVDIVTHLIKQGWSVHRTDALLETPLHLAARTGNIEITRVLMNAGAKNFTLNCFDDTPSALAKQCGYVKLHSLLMT